MPRADALKLQRELGRVLSDGTVDELGIQREPVLGAWVALEIAVRGWLGR